MKFDVLVIGSGMAGAAAALKAAEPGREVGVVRRGYGATALSSGAIDLAADPAGIPGRPWEGERDWRRNVKEVSRRNRFHPYAVLDADGESLEEGLGFITARLAEAGLSLSGSQGNNLLLVNSRGGVKLTGLAQEPQGKGDLGILKGKKIFIIGIKHLPDFPAGLISGLLSEQLEPEGYGPFAAREIDLPGFTGGTFMEAVEAMEEGGAEKLASEFGGRGEEEHLIFPPILGIRRQDEVTAALQSGGWSDFSEALAVPVSIPGYRLQLALDRALEKQGVKVINGRAVGAVVSGRRVKSVKVTQENGEESIEAKVFILAGGKFLAGGIERGKEFKEPIFDLPVFIEGKVVLDEFIKDFLARDPLGPHPVFRAGVKVDGDLRSVDREGGTAYENLLAAGAVLAGYDAAGDGSGMGGAVLTGFRAGIESARLL